MTNPDICAVINSEDIQRLLKTDESVKDFMIHRAYYRGVLEMSVYWNEAYWFLTFDGEWIRVAGWD